MTRVKMAYEGEEEDKLKAQFVDMSFHVAIQLPIDAGMLDAAITRAILIDPTATLDHDQRSRWRPRTSYRDVQSRP